MQMMQGLKTGMEALEKRVTEIQARPASTSAGTGTSGQVVQPPAATTGQQATPFRRVEVKLTEFNSLRVDRWFEETERALTAANITASTDKVVAIQKYIPDHIREVKQSIFNTNDYEQVKQAVIKAVEKSEEERYRAYHAVQMGDRKPGDFFAEILSHAPMDAQKFQDMMVKHRFLSGIPADLALHMQSYDFTLAAGRHAASVESYVRRVDDLYNLSKKRSVAVNSVDNADDDEAAIDAIMNRMGKDKFQQKFQQKFGGGPNKGASGKKRGDSRYADRLCQTHKVHGEKAYSCLKTDTCPMATVITPKPEQKSKK